MLAARRVAVEPDAKATDKPSRTAQADDGDRGIGDVMKDALFGTKRRQGMIETMAKQTARTVGSQMGRKILRGLLRSEEHTSELQSLMRISYAVFCLKKKKN